MMSVRHKYSASSTRHVMKCGIKPNRDYHEDKRQSGKLQIISWMTDKTTNAWKNCQIRLASAEQILEFRHLSDSTKFYAICIYWYLYILIFWCIDIIITIYQALLVGLRICWLYLQRRDKAPLKKGVSLVWH